MESTLRFMQPSVLTSSTPINPSIPSPVPTKPARPPPFVLLKPARISKVPLPHWLSFLLPLERRHRCPCLQTTRYTMPLLLTPALHLLPLSPHLTTHLFQCPTSKLPPPTAIPLNSGNVLPPTPNHNWLSYPMISLKLEENEGSLNCGTDSLKIYPKFFCQLKITNYVKIMYYT